MELKKLDKIIYLYLFIPLGIVAGPLIPDLIISLLAFYFIIFYFDKIIFYIKKYNFLKILTIFCLLNIVTSFFSENIYASLKNSITYLRFPILIILSIYFLKNKIDFFKYFYLILFATILVVCLDALLQFFYGQNIFGFVSNSKNRISGLFHDEYILGSYLVRFTPILISLFFFNNRERNTLPLVLLSILSFFTILISGERTALGIAVIFYLLFFIFILNASYKKKLFLSLILIIIIALTILSSEKFKERYIKTTMYQIQAFIENKENSDIGIYNNQHLKHIKVSYEIFKEKPIFGHGNKMFGQICFERYFINDGRCSTHPHNFLAQILVENGLVGILFYLSIFFYLIIYFYKSHSNKDKSTSTILLLTILSFFPLFPSGNFYNNLMSIFLYIPLSIFFVFNESKK